MESRSLNPKRQLMVKGKKEGQSNRATRAFVALQNRKISRNNGIEKKRGMPLSEMSNIHENEAQNCQDQTKTEKDPETTKHVDPIKEALKKWQKDKRLRQIREKKMKKTPFCVSTVSHRISEYSHSFQNARDEIYTTQSNQNDVSNIKVVPPQKNISAAKKAKPLGSSRKKKTGIDGSKTSIRSSCRTMKTRSMTTKNSNPTSNNISTNSGCVSMEIDNIPTSQTTCYSKGLPARVTRSRTNENVATEKPDSSTIPNMFSFNVPPGIESFAFCADKFTFTPLSPNSAQKFFPTRSHDMELPNETEQPCLAENENGMKENGALGEQEVRHVVLSGGGTTVSAEMKDIGDQKTSTHVLDTTYFRNLANSEIDRLKCRCAHLENENEQDEAIPEEVKGMIRTVTGQVQLLVTKKFKQFSGLLDLSEDSTAEKKALVSDLQGFWDMMYIQVEQIDKKFKELEQMKENNWQNKNIDVEVKKKNVKRTTKAKKSSKTANPKVSANRNKFHEMRAQMKAKLEAEKNEGQDAFKIILTPMKNKKADADPSEPGIILTPVRRSTRKSRGCANFAIPLVNIPNVSVDLFGACKTPEATQTNECLSNLQDSAFRPQHPTSITQFSTSDNLMVFSPTTPVKRV